MSKINTSNYEAYLIDHLEGHLNEEETAMLMIFLEQNPDVKAELEEFEHISISGSQAALDEDFKSQLLKEESTELSRLDYLLIAELEGQLTSSEKQELERLESRHESVRKQQSLYAKTILHSNPAVRFDHKDQLKKRGIVFSLYQNVATIAAILIVALLLGQLLVSEPIYQPKGSPISKIENSPQNEVEELWPNFVIRDELEKSPEQQLEENTILLEEVYSTNLAQVGKALDRIKEKRKDEQLPIVEDNSDSFAMNDSLSNDTSRVMPSSINQDFVEEYADVTDLPSMDHTNENLNEKDHSQAEFVPVSDFAKQRLKENILKNKTISEAIADEIAKATKDKITFDQVINQKGKREKFALNIGKLKISKNN